jgi:hypothetical protein
MFLPASNNVVQLPRELYLGCLMNDAIILRDLSNPWRHERGERGGRQTDTQIK